MSAAPRRRQFKIEPFKHKVEMDPKYADRTWLLLQDAINKIYDHNASTLSFEELYRSVHQVHGGVVRVQRTTVESFIVS